MIKNILFVAIFAFVCVGGACESFAEGKYSIKEMTPAVQSALDNRRDRFDQLRQLKSAGSLGETNRGYVKALDASASSVADAENRDRATIYQTIAEQNGLGGAVATIESVFGEVQRGKAEAGDKIQNEDGAWVTK